MPIIKSAIKRARQSQKRHQYNLQVKRAVKSDIKSFHNALKSTGANEIEAAFKAAISELDRAVKKGTLHKNTATRHKSQLAKLLAAGPAKPAAKTPGVKSKAKSAK